MRSAKAERPLDTVFRPNVNSKIWLNQCCYRFLEHPSAPGYVFGQEGKAATVYQLQSSDEKSAFGKSIALKVFKPQHRTPKLVSLTRQTSKFASLKGFRVLQRTVLAPPEFEELLSQERDLVYSIVMPWIEGPNWMEIIGTKREFSQIQCQQIARLVAESLLALEHEGLSHCDLSSANILLPELVTQGKGIEFVDVEQFYAPGIDRPKILTSGSPGYSSSTLVDQLWSSAGDRLAGAIILSEMLCWCDAEFRGKSGLESYFEPDEVGRPGSRYELMVATLDRLWGKDAAGLLISAWTADSLENAPLFADWLMAIPKPETSKFRLEPTTTPKAHASVGSGPSMLQTQLDLASAFEVEGKTEQALSAYRRAQKLVGPNQALASELDIVIVELEREVERQRAREAPPLAVAAKPEAKPTATLRRSPGPTPRKVLVPALALLAGSLFSYQSWTHRPGRISVYCDIAGASIKLDGQIKGMTSAKENGDPVVKASVPPGSHQITVSLKGYKPQTRQLEIQAGEERTLAFKLEPILVDLRFKLNPPSVNLSMNGSTFKPVKTGSVTSYAPGEYQIRASAVGYKSFASKFTLEADHPKTLAINLQPALHELEVKTSTEPAHVVVKTKEGGVAAQGQTQQGKFSCAVVPGSYVILVTKDGYEDASQECSVALKDGKKSLSITLNQIVVAPVETDQPGKPVQIQAENNGVQVQFNRGGFQVKAGF
ncbi:PEGA domain-containing protein [bacterium]|nr:PEGA domain-containing protein [bacterium]